MDFRRRPQLLAHKNVYLNFAKPSLKVKILPSIIAAYYFLIFTVGRIQELKQFIIWFGWLVIFLLILTEKAYRIRDISRESYFMLIFIVWSLFGAIIVVDWLLYFTFLKMVIEYLIFIICISLVIKKSIDIKVIWYAFIVTALYNLVMVFLSPSESGYFSSIHELSKMDRSMGIMGNPNTLAYLYFMGIIGVLELLGEKLSFWLKIMLVFLGCVIIIGSLFTASRGGFLIILISLPIWFFMCFGSLIQGKTRKIISIISVLVIIGSLYGSYGWVLDNTKLGMRTQRGLQGSDTSSQTRNDLNNIALNIAIHNPINGVGLGQFAIVSGTGLYAHNEWAELISTTGVIGFLLYMAVYWAAWLRLVNASKKTKNKILLYRINFARTLLITIVISGAIFRINFIDVSAMFLLSIVVGVSLWAQNQIYKEKILYSSNKSFKMIR